MQILHRLYLAVGLVTLASLSACADPVDSSSASLTQAESVGQSLTVYKSDTCQCCNKWIDHLESSGFETSVEHPTDLNGVKDRLQVPGNVRSCHTAVSEHGFVFEGHIPQRYIRQFLDNPPQDALGLAVPGMPIGSPGMEMGDRFTPYQILLLKRDGSTEVFATVDSLAQQ